MPKYRFNDRPKHSLQVGDKIVFGGGLIELHDEDARDPRLFPAPIDSEVTEGKVSEMAPTVVAQVTVNTDGTTE